jgi:hypothetical protein
MDYCMKKVLYTLLFCCLLPSLGAAEYLAEFKVGYFRPTHDVLRELFSDGLPNYQLELSYSPFSRNCDGWWRHFFAWGSVNYVHDEGNSAVGIEDCAIDIIPLALGLKYMQPLPCCVQAYLSAGFKYFWFHVDSHTPTAHQKDRARGLGGVVAIGALFHPIRNVFLDFFVDYSFKHFDKDNFSIKQNGFIPSSIDASGLTFGLGAGVWF